MRKVFRQSPNISAGRTINPIGIILHHSGGSYEGTINWCLNPASKVSYHCVVNTDGSITELAQDNQRAFHAGASFFMGRRDCNSFMLGISVTGDTYLRRLTNQEINAVANWCVEKMTKFKIPIQNITTHRAVSPGRKLDVDPRAETDIIHRIKQIL